MGWDLFSNPLYLLYMATIGIKFQNNTYINTDMSNYDFECGYAQGEYNITVLCDGSEFINHFTLISDESYNWITIHRDRNYITLVIKENCGLKERMGRLVFKHNLDDNAVFTFEIYQAARVYEITADKFQIIFDALLAQQDNDKIVEIVNISTEGGLEDFGVKPVKEYVRNEIDANYKEIHYDNGLRLTKLNNTQLQIENFGQVSMYDYVYYIITLYHRNDPSSTWEIRVEYTEPHNTDLSFDDDE